MTPLAPIPKSKKIIRIAVDFFSLPVIAALTVFNGWGVWDGLYAYHYVGKSTNIDAEIISTRVHKLTLSGKIRFRTYVKGAYLECISEVKLSPESKYLKYNPGTMIEIIPRTGCDDPIVVGNAKLPFIDILLCAFYLAVGLVILRDLSSALRQETA